MPFAKNEQKRCGHDEQAAAMTAPILDVVQRNRTYKHGVTPNRIHYRISCCLQSCMGLKYTCSTSGGLLEVCSPTAVAVRMTGPPDASGDSTGCFIISGLCSDTCGEPSPDALLGLNG